MHGDFENAAVREKESAYVWSAQVGAAKRAGVHDVILPAENRTNVEEDLTPEQLVGLTTHYVKTIDEVLEFALPSTPSEEMQDAEEREKVLSS